MGFFNEKSKRKVKLMFIEYFYTYYEKGGKVRVQHDSLINYHGSASMFEEYEPKLSECRMMVPLCS